MKKNLLYISIFTSSLLVASIACGSNNSGILVEEGKPTSKSEVSPDEPILPQSYKVGDVIEVRDHRITLVSTDFQTGILVANFLIENTGSDEINVSSILNFSVRDNEGTNLDQEIFDCGPGLDGSVLSGDLLRGNICWSGATTTVKIYYEPSLWGSTTVVWEVTESAVSDVNIERIEIQTFSIGDVISVRGHNITLETASVLNGILTATFLIENVGTEEINVSSILSFEARNASGTKLEQEIFDCDSSLDGSVIAGDKLKGSICWSGATLPVRIYYDASLFGSGSVVWGINE